MLSVCTNGLTSYLKVHSIFSLDTDKTPNNDHTIHVTSISARSPSMLRGFAKALRKDKLESQARLRVAK